MDTNFFRALLADPKRALKVAGVIIIGLLLVAVALQILSSTLRPLAKGFNTIAPSIGYGGGTAYYDGDYSYATEESMAQLSVRNVAGSIAPYPQSPSGDDAEAYEVTQYSATIETRKLESTCAAFEELKKREDVIFDSANSHDRGCDFSFKVKHESVEEVLAWLNDFDPKDLSENTYTIKRQVDDFTSEVEVLQKKRASIDATLASALSAYDEITALATRTQNADALAKIIDSRIGIIERLTQERININEQLDRLTRAKAEQLDRLEYTYFYVNVYENKFVDGEELADGWKQAVREAIRDVNQIVQEVTLGLIALLFLIAQWVLYAFIVLIVAKYCWRIAKYVWYR